MLWHKHAARFISAGQEITANNYKLLRLAGDLRIWGLNVALVTGNLVSFQIIDMGGRMPSFPVALCALKS